jgi:hypothetical protein
VVGHRDVVTGFIWHKTVPDCVIACSKDGTLRCHNLKVPIVPSELLLPFALLICFVEHYYRKRIGHTNTSARWACRGTCAMSWPISTTLSIGITQPQSMAIPFLVDCQATPAVADSR